MAYFHSYGIADNTADMLVKLKSFLIDTVGWTLFDDQMNLTEPYFVAFSSGESGVEDIYLKFANDSTTNVVNVTGYLYWNASTHAGVKPVNYSTGLSTLDSASFAYWLFADLDHFSVITKPSTTYVAAYYGVIRRYWSASIAISTGGVSAGSNVVVPVSNASIFTAGRAYIIKDNANLQRCTVSAVDIGANTITIASLSTAFTTGAKIGEDPQPVLLSRTDLVGCGVMINKWDGYNTPIHLMTFGMYCTIQDSVLTDSDRDSRYGYAAIYPCLVTSTDEVRGELIGIYRCGTDAGGTDDTILIGSTSYRLFSLATTGLIAVRE